MTVTVVGSGGTVSSSSSGINCPSDCAESYPAGTQITLTTAPNANDTIIWSGCAANGNACTVTMSTARNVTATFTASVPPTAGGPRLFYTDIVTGPNTGGEDNHGAYLTLFGAGFGDPQSSGVPQPGSQVTINNVPVAAYKQWSNTKITVQPGTGVTSGAIRVTVDGKPSNVDQTFTVVNNDDAGAASKIWFVALSGNDATCVPNDITRPCRLITETINRTNFTAGDHLVIRGGTWSDVYAQYSSFFSIAHKGGTSTAPIAIMGYPGESVRFVRTTQTRGVHTYDSPGYFTIANLSVDLQNGSGGMMLGVGTIGVRLVNNEITGLWENSGGSAMIDGSGKNFRILGNHIHDGGGSKLYHGVYIDARDTTDNGPHDIEIAYNHIHHIKGGRGVQIYGDTGTHINDVKIHHNRIHHIALNGIVLARDAGTGMQVFNNIIYHTADPAMRGATGDEGTSGGCIRFVSDYVVAQVYNNTLVDCAVDNDQYSAAILFQQAGQVVLRNNLVVGKYFDFDSAWTGSLISSNNLWYDGINTPPPWDTDPQTGDPRFANAATPTPDFHLLTGSPAIDHGSSAVNATVTTDFDGIARPRGQSNLFDIGAYEYK
ncbi:MAG: right-handed parallel beta-helix repeat-containing protein [Gammaproteobacteria bacterium]|nr:right-handed parallel beta-helix repeat-containing protein [Gammaproteobacteria bacterium]